MASAALDKALSALSALNLKYKRSGPSDRSYLAQCPVHDDHDPSMSVTDGTEGVVFHCHACGAGGLIVVEALGLKWEDVFHQPLKKENRGSRQRDGKEYYKKSEIIARYDYTDINGTLLYQVCRTADKQFPQRRPDPAKPNKWIWSVPAALRVLYGLPELTAAVAEGRTVYIPEGEKDVNNLRSLGLAATCNPCGAGKWDRRYSDTLQGAKVVLLQDNDQAGRDHCARVLSLLQGVVAEIRILLLPGLPDKGDISDWLAADAVSNTAEELERLAKEAPIYSALSSPAASESDKQNSNVFTPDPANLDFHFSDTGNGNRLASLFGENIRYSKVLKKWFIWDGKRWEPDEVGEIYELAKKTVVSIYKEAEKLSTFEERNALCKHALRSESMRGLEEMTRAAGSKVEIRIVPEALDSNDWKLNCLNGALDLRTGGLLSHSRIDYITKLIPISYDPSAVCPAWLAFLDRVFASDADLISFVQRAVGYSLTGSTREQCMFFLYGNGRNGKSTFIDTIMALLSSYSVKTPTETLIFKDRSSSISNDVARLKGSRLVTACETGDGHRLNESLIKDFTGGDLITARFLRAEFFDFRPAFKLWLYGNYKPLITGTDDGIWRRLQMIPFMIQIPQSEVDADLKDKLLLELPGILRWAVEGCLAWQERGLASPLSVSGATSAYRSEMDVIGRFLFERCGFAPNVQILSSVLLTAYSDWCEENGEDKAPKKLWAELKSRGIKNERIKGEQRGWRGIALTSAAVAAPVISPITAISTPVNGAGRPKTDISDRSDAISPIPLHARDSLNSDLLSDLSDVSVNNKIEMDLSTLDESYEQAKIIRMKK